MSAEHYDIKGAKTRPGAVSGQNWATPGTFARATTTPRHRVLAATPAIPDDGAAGCVTRVGCRGLPCWGRPEGYRHQSRQMIHQPGSRLPSPTTGWLQSFLPTPKWPSRQRRNPLEANGTLARTPSGSAESSPHWSAVPTSPCSTTATQPLLTSRLVKNGPGTAAGHYLTVRPAPVPERSSRRRGHLLHPHGADPAGSAARRVHIRTRVADPTVGDRRAAEASAQRARVPLL